MTDSASDSPVPVVPDHELLRPIGRGSYGEVWLARSVLGELRAVKLVRHSGPTGFGPASREFDGLRKFEPISRAHPGLVHVLHAGRFDGGFFYVMELADDAQAQVGGRKSEPGEGRPQRDAAGDATRGTIPDAQSSIPPSALAAYSPRTLRSELQHRGRLPVAECIDLALQLTDALGHLHGHGLVHRDIKPSNIIFVGGRPKLADIGLVASADASMSCVGTEGYLPPEGPGKPPADLYALGKVLYELATGRDRTDFPELPTLLRDDPERDALEELNEVILKACDPDIRRRYRSAEQMRADLLSLKHGRSIRWKHGMSRRLAIARLAGGAAGGVALLAAGGFWVQRRHTHEARRLRQVAEDLAARAKIQHAEDLFARGESSLALANLAQILRADSSQRVAAERVMAALSQRSFPRLVAPPLRHPDRLQSARFSPDGLWIVALSREPALRFWNAVSGEEAHPPVVHSGRINSVDFSPDGRRIITASADGQCFILDVATGTAALPPLSQGGPATAALYCPKGDMIATAAEDARVRLYNAATGALRGDPLPHEAAVTALDFDPDGQWLATVAADAKIRIWEAATGSLQQELALDGGGAHLRVSRNGEWVAATLQHSERFHWQVQAWNLKSGSPQAVTLPHENRIYSLAFSPDSRLLLTGTFNNTARLWDLASGRLLLQLHHSAAVYAAEFSPDGGRILTASVDKTARVWDARTGKPIAEAMNHEARVVHAEFSRDGRRVLTASWDRTVKEWEMPAAQPFGKTLAHSRRVSSGEFDPTGRRVLTATTRTLFTASRINSWDLGGPQVASVWEVDTGRQTSGTKLTPQAGIITARWTTAGPLALVARQELTREKALRADPEFSNQARVWDVSAGIPLGDTLSHRHDIVSAHFSADGAKLAVGTTRGEIRVWDSRRGVALAPSLTHAGWINSVRFSPDARKLVSCSAEGSAMIWDAVSGALLAGPLKHGSEVWFAQFSPLGDRIITATAGHHAKVWSVSGDLLADFSLGGPVTAPRSKDAPIINWEVCDPVEYAEFSPDGGLVVIAAGDRARIWDAALGKQIAELAHAQLVVMARFNPDGRRVLTASFDGTAQLWDTATGLKLADPFRHDSQVGSAVFSANGQQMVTTSTDSTAKIWELPQVSTPVPDWFPAFVESVAGLRLTPGEIPTPVRWSERESLKSDLASLPSTEPLVPWALSLLNGSEKPRSKFG